jgi:hypothetical protein
MNVHETICILLPNCFTEKSTQPALPGGRVRVDVDGLTGGFRNSGQRRSGDRLPRWANRDAKVTDLSIHDVVNPAVDENITDGAIFA